MNIQLRKIEEKDLELLRQWRMKDNVTKYMFTDPKISMEEQRVWYHKISNDTSRLDLTINVDEKVIGHYYITDIDANKKECQVGFYIGDDHYRGKGIYKSVQIAINRFIIRTLGFGKIIIYSFAENPNCKQYHDLEFIEDESKSYKYIKNNKEHLIKCYVLSKDGFVDILDENNNVKIYYN